MELTHERLLHEIEKHYLENNDFLTVRELKVLAKEKGIKVGTDKAAELIRAVKKKYSNALSKQLEAMAALIGKPLDEVVKEIEHLAKTADISTMTKSQLCTALCALRPYSYARVRELSRDELRKQVIEVRRQEKAAEFRFLIGFYSDYENPSSY